MDLSIGKLVAKRAAMNPTKECYRDVLSGHSLTFQEHNTRTDQTAHMLKDLGIVKGDRDRRQLNAWLLEFTRSH